MAEGGELPKGFMLRVMRDEVSRCRFAPTSGAGLEALVKRMTSSSGGVLTLGGAPVHEASRGPFVFASVAMSGLQ